MFWQKNFVTFPLREARCSAVFPLLVAALTCAPLDNKPATTDAWPSFADK